MQDLTLDLQHATAQMVQLLDDKASHHHEDNLWQNYHSLHQSVAHLLTRCQKLDHLPELTVLLEYATCMVEIAQRALDTLNQASLEPEESNEHNEWLSVSLQWTALALQLLEPLQQHSHAFVELLQRLWRTLCIFPTPRLTGLLWVATHALLQPYASQPALLLGETQNLALCTLRLVPHIPQEWGPNALWSILIDLIQQQRHLNDNDQADAVRELQRVLQVGLLSTLQTNPHVPHDLPGLVPLYQAARTRSHPSGDAYDDYFDLMWSQCMTDPNDYNI